MVRELLMTSNLNIIWCRRVRISHNLFHRSLWPRILMLTIKWGIPSKWGIVEEDPCQRQMRVYRTLGTSRSMLMRCLPSRECLTRGSSIRGSNLVNFISSLRKMGIKECRSFHRIRSRPAMGRGVRELSMIDINDTRLRIKSHLPNPKYTQWSRSCLGRRAIPTHRRHRPPHTPTTAATVKNSKTRWFWAS